MNKLAVAKELVRLAKHLIGGGWGRFSEDLSDVLEAQAAIHKHKGLREMFRLIKSDVDIVRMMREEGMTDRDLNEFLNDVS